MQVPKNIAKHETGRTHQIRVHMAHVGHPLEGDTVYGRSPSIRRMNEQFGVSTAEFSVARPMLHAYKLGFVPGHGRAAGVHRAAAGRIQPIDPITMNPLREMIDCTIQELERMKRQGITHVAVSRDTLQALGAPVPAPKRARSTPAPSAVPAASGVSVA